MLRKPAWFRFGLVGGGLALALAVPVRASAQRGRQLPTLEAIVAPADRVFTGTVVETAGNTWTIHVAENLKGSGPDTVVLPLGGIDESGMTRALAPNHAYLWAIGPDLPARWGPLAYPAGTMGVKRQPTRWLIVDLDTLTERDENDYGRYALPIFAEDLSVVRSREAALARVRAFAKAHPAPLPVLQAQLPNEFVGRQGISPNAFALVVFPQDDAAEAVAHRLIDRPLEFVGKEGAETDPTRRAARADERRWWIVHTRETGIRLLAPFKTPANVARLHRLLTDPSLLPDPLASYDAAPWVYVIRSAAYDVLRGWDVAVPKPVLKAPRP